MAFPTTTPAPTCSACPHHPCSLCGAPIEWSKRQGRYLNVHSDLTAHRCPVETPVGARDLEVRLKAAGEERRSGNQRHAEPKAARAPKQQREQQIPSQPANEAAPPIAPPHEDKPQPRRKPRGRAIQG